MTRRDWWLGVTLVAAAVTAHGLIVRAQPAGTRRGGGAPWVLWSGFQTTAAQLTWTWEVDDAFQTRQECSDAAHAIARAKRATLESLKPTDDMSGVGYSFWNSQKANVREIWRCMPDSVNLPLWMRNDR